MRRLGTGSGFVFLLTTTVLAAGFTPQIGVTPAAAQTAGQQVYSFNIQPKPVRQALNDISRITGVSVVFNETAAGSVNGNAVSGSMTREQALAALLTSTGLSWSFTNPGTVTIGSRVAQAFDVPADDSLVLDTITISGNSGEYLGGVGNEDVAYRTAATVNHISQENIQRFRGSSVGDFLKGTPGVQVGDTRNSGAVDINVRGMQGFGRVPVVVDGSQQQNTVYRGYSGVASRNYIDPDMIGAVTIEKGPSAGVHGTGATGGVAHMRTLEADDILRDGEHFGFRVKGGLVSNTSSPPPAGTPGGLSGAGMYIGTLHPDGSETFSQPLPDTHQHVRPGRPAFLEPTSGNGSVAWAGRWDNLELVAAYNRRKTGNYHAGTRGHVPEVEISDSYSALRPDGSRVINRWYTIAGLNRFTAGEEVLNSSQDNTSYLAKGKLTLDGGHTFNLGYMNYQSRFGELMPSVIIRGEGALQAPLSDVDHHMFTGRYNWNPDSNDFINLTANLWRTHTETVIRTPYEFFGIQMPESYWDVARRTGGDISNESIVDTGLGQLTLQYGGSYVYETLAPPSDRPAPPPGGSNLEARDGWRREASVFAASQWQPLDWLKFDASLRYTHTHSYDKRSTRIPSGPHQGEWLNNEQENSGFAPIMAVTVEPVDGFQLYGRYAEAIRSASLFESTSGWSFEAAPLLHLKPEHARNWEFGTNILLDDAFGAGDRLRLAGSYFNNTIDNYLTRTIETSFGSTNGVPATTMRNIHNAKFQGFELSGSYDMGRFFGEFGGIYYRKVEFCVFEDDASCRPGGVPSGYAQLHLPPKYSISATLGARLFDRRLTVGGRYTYEATRPADNSNAQSGGYITPIVWPAYHVVDLFTSYDLNDHLKLDINIDNLTDTYHLDPLAVGLMPAPGRTVRASLTAKF